MPRLKVPPPPDVTSPVRRRRKPRVRLPLSTRSEHVEQPKVAYRRRPKYPVLLEADE